MIVISGGTPPVDVGSEVGTGMVMIRVDIGVVIWVCVSVKTMDDWPPPD